MSDNFRIKWAGIIIFLFAKAGLGMPLIVEPVPYERDTLDNGLQVIYAPMPLSKVVHVRVIYHVGSRDERPDRQGFAHMFEHMMFRGSAHVSANEYIRRIRAVGGEANARTEQDITTFYETVPNNQLAMALYLEADRMASFHVTEQAFRVERNVVLEEISLKTESPFVANQNDFLAALFPTHPYRWSPLGNPNQLKAADASELQKFFDEFYVPNNAALVIAGGFETPVARELVHRYFEWIEKGAKVVRQIAPEPPQTAPRRIEIERAILQPVVMMGVRAPSYGSEDDAVAIVLLKDIERKLIQYLKLDDNHICSSVFSQLFPFEDDGYLCFGGVLYPNADLARMQRIVDIRLQMLREEGFGLSEVDFGVFVDGLCSELLAQRQSVEGRAEQLGKGLVLRGDPEVTDKLIRRLHALTAMKLHEAAVKYLQPGAITTVLIRPPTALVMARPIQRTTEPLAEVLASSTQPVGAPRTVLFPLNYPTTALTAPFTQVNLKDNTLVAVIQGTRVIETQVAPIGKVGVRIIFPHGLMDDPAGKEGLGNLTASLGAHDTRLGITLGDDFTEISALISIDSVDAFAREWNAWMHKPLRPVDEIEIRGFKQDLFKRRRAEDGIRESAAAHELRQALFANSALGRGATLETLRSITPDDVDHYREILFSGSGAIIVIRSDLKPEQVKLLISPLIEVLSHNQKDAEPAAAAQFSPSTIPSQDETKPRIILIDAPDSHESIIRVGATATFGGKDKPAALLGDWILSQRIWNTVRSDKGYAYVVDADIMRSRSTGVFGVKTEASCANTGIILKNLLEQFRDIGENDVSDDELKEAGSAFANRAAMNVLRPEELSILQSIALLHDEGIDRNEFNRRMASVTAGEIRELFGRYYHSGPLAIVVVAPAAEVKSQLELIGDVKVSQMPNLRPGASTRPAYDEFPIPY